MYRRWNHEYPAKMRARGWDIEDCEPDPNADKGKHGESAISFKRRKIREKEKELAKEQAELKREKKASQKPVNRLRTTLNRLDVLRYRG